MNDSSRLLYKYFQYNEHLLEMLFTKKIWYSKPDTFNDPFDCHLNFDPHIPEDKYEKCLRWQLKREGRSPSQIDDDIRKLISKDGIVNDEARKVIDEIAASTIDVIKRIGVLCLTESNSDVTPYTKTSNYPSPAGHVFGFQVVCVWRCFQDRRNEVAFGQI